MRNRQPVLKPIFSKAHPLLGHIRNDPGIPGREVGEVKQFGRCLFAVVLLACSAAPACLAQDGAAVYFYRYRQFQGAALTPAVYCDEMQLARMENGRYFVVHLPPGQHTCRSNDKQSGVQIDLKAGEDYYLRVELVAGMLKGHGRLVLTAKEQGAFEIIKLKPMEPSKLSIATVAP